MEFAEKAIVMTAADISRVLARMASQIVESNPDLTDVLLVGIRRRGRCRASRDDGQGDEERSHLSSLIQPGAGTVPSGEPRS